MNLWNIWHGLAPFGSILTALLILEQKPNPLSNFERTQYYAGVYLVFSLIIFAISIFPPLALPKNKKNFLVFMINYPIWFFAGIIPYFSETAIVGAWASFFILFIAMVVQIVIYVVAESYTD